ncbi:MAG: hypothetical protein ETSY2_24985 [Candidatus Entotheonella gemina]|uniref:Uncharacterized protein n=2 Tax=Candidatus Entotheonella TaxID=93171 RepID=W4M4H6_9BACT|nr:MAG: hypothetical protein ETSY2_24985 [Candidatus Entotheonella gemina]
MSRNVIVLAVILLLLLVAGGVYYRSQTALQAQSTDAPAQPQAKSNQPAKKAKKAPQPRPVHVTQVQRGSIQQAITATGDILAAAKVDVYSKAEGRLQSIRIEPGDQVQHHHIIARIDDAELRARMERTAAELDVLQAEWAQMQAGERPEEIARAAESVRRSRAEWDNAKLELERAKALYDKGLYATQQLDNARLHTAQARAAHAMAEKQLRIVRTGARVEDRQALQAQLRAAEAALRLAQTQLQNAVITAPMTGIISHRHVDPGAYITDNTVMATLVDMQTVKIKVPIGERDLGHIRPGLKAQIRVDTYPDHIFPGTVARLSPTLDPANRSADVEIVIDNADLRLKPGMFAKVDLILRQRDDALLVPRQAVQSQGEVASVFVVKQGKAYRHEVTLGLQNGSQVEILGQLDAGTTIVLAGHHQLKDQASIIVVE